MTLLVFLYAFGILKVVHPLEGQPIYLLVDPVCVNLIAGTVPREVKLVITNPWPGDEGRPEVVGYVKWEVFRCDVEHVVVSGP